MWDIYGDRDEEEIQWDLVGVICKKSLRIFDCKSLRLMAENEWLSYRRVG